MTNTAVSARVRKLWRSRRFAGSVALLFAVFTLLAAAGPHEHNALGVANAAPNQGQPGAAQTLALSQPVASVSPTSCALCDWLTLPSLPVCASSVALAPVFAAFVLFVVAPTPAVRVTAKRAPQGRGPPPAFLSPA